MTLIAEDTFERANNSSSWGTASNGSTWSHGTGTSAIELLSNQGVVEVTTSSGSDILLLGSGTLASGSARVRMIVGSTTNSVGLVLRSDSTGANCYFCRLNGTNTIQIFKRISSAGTLISSQSAGITFSAGSVVWMEFRASSTSLSMKCWLEGTTEPGFLTPSTDSTYATGQYGVYVKDGATANEGFTEYRVTDTTSGTGVAYDVALRGVLAAAASTHDLALRGLVFYVADHDIALRGIVQPASVVVAHDIALRGTVAPRLLGAGGAACFANGSGVVNFDHVRVTQYPDPALALGPVVPRAGQSLIAWDATLPTNTSLAVKVALDSQYGPLTWVDVTADEGQNLPGITSQSAPTVDTFGVGSVNAYTATKRSGGSAAIWTFDTANMRVIATGGSDAALLTTNSITPVVGSEWDITFDMDTADGGGCVFSWSDTQDFYALTVHDNLASTGVPNTVQAKKLLSNTYSSLGSIATINFTRGVIHRFHANFLGGSLSVWMDGTLILSATDSSPLPQGQAGLRANGGTNQFYSLWLCPQGQNVSGTPIGDTVTGSFLYTQYVLTTTDPTVGPQLLDTTTSVRSPTIETGVQIAELHSQSSPSASFVSAEIQNLVSQCGDWWWKLDRNKLLSFRSPRSVPAPFVLSSVNSSNIYVKTKTQTKVTLGGDTYRNTQTVLPLSGTVTPAPYLFISDGSATSWTVGYPIVSTPTVLVNGIAQSVGQTGVDTGKTFYWQPGNNTVTLASGLSAFPFGYNLSIAIVGSYETLVTVSDPVGIAARAAVEQGTSGIVEAIYQIPNQSSSNLLSTQAGTTMANAYIARFEHETTDLACDTAMTGLAPGQTVSVFLPEHGLWNKQLVIFKVSTSVLVTPPSGTPFYIYSIEASDGPNIGPWADGLSGRGVGHKS